jgi:hypothetical protein
MGAALGVACRLRMDDSRPTSRPRGRPSVHFVPSLSAEYVPPGPDKWGPGISAPVAASGGAVFGRGCGTAFLAELS